MYPASNMAGRNSGSSAGRNVTNTGRNTAATSTTATGRVTRSTAAAPPAAAHYGRSGQAVGYTMTGKALATTGKGSSASGPGSGRDARATGSTAVATQGGTGNVTSTLTTMPSRLFTTSTTISEAFTMAEPICFILLVDKEVQGSASDSLLYQHHAPSSKRILKGSLLQGYEVPPVGGQSHGDVVKSSKRTDAKQFVVKPLSGDMQFECSSSEIARITGREMDLLRAISTNSDRLNIYQDKDLLPYALSLKEGSLVKVRHRNHSSSPYEEVAAIVRYIGPLSGTEMGTQFGLELRDNAYRGQGTSDGVFGKCRYFQTEHDCALFVPISKLVPPSKSQGTTDLYENVPRSNQELPNQPSELRSVGDIKKGTTVYLQVGNWTRRGKVTYMTFPFKETEAYAVVEMPKQDGDRMWNGMHKGYHVFTPRNEVFTTFVPVNNLTTRAPEEYQDLFPEEPSPNLPSKAKKKGKKASEGFFAANAKPRKTPSPYASSEKLDKASHKSSGGRRDVSDNYNQESFFEANNKPRKTRSPYASSEKLDKGSHKPSGGRRDVSDSYHPAFHTHKTFSRQDTSEDIQFSSGHFGEGSKSKHDSYSGFVNKMKNKGNNGSKDEETSRSSWYTDTKATEANFLEEDLVEEVVNKIYKDWRTVGYFLYLSKEEMDKIEGKYKTERERTREMLKAWQRKGTGYDKISKLAEACRNCNLKELANELEQGLDETLLFKIARGIPPEKARPFGMFLNFSDEEMGVFEAETPHTLPRVRFMLAKWRTRQSHNSDKIMLLSNALKSCGLTQLALEVARGLDDDIMLSFAVQIGHNWKILATRLHLDVKDIQQLGDFSEDKQPYQMLMLWRRRQDRSVDVLGALAKGLRESGLPDLAYNLVQGVTDEMLYTLAMLIGDRWEAIALHLGFTLEELKDIKSDKCSDETATILSMLTKWRERHDYTRDRFGFLMEALRACDLSNIAESFEEERHRVEQSKKVAPSAKTEEYPGYAKDKESFYAANNKPRKTRSPYASSEKLDSHKPSGGKRDVSDNYNPASQAHKTFSCQDTSEDLQFSSGKFDKVKNKWNNGSKDEETSKSSWYTESYVRPGDAARGSYLDTKATGADNLEEDVVEEVAKTIYRDWRTVGHYLYLSREEIDRIAAKCRTEKDRTVEMLRAWQRKGTGYDNISRLAEACRSCHFEELANELEQGLDKTLLFKIAGGIPAEKARPFGLFLNFSDEEMDVFEVETPHTLPRVRFMLAKWRTRQSHNSDKIMLLSNALQSCGFRQLALEVARGLDDDIMLSFAVQIGHIWKILATRLRLGINDIKQLEDFSADKQPYQMLMLWRRRQDRSVDVLGALAKGLQESGLPNLAYDLVQGVTDEMLYKLAIMIGDKWEAVAQCLGFNEEELKELKGDRNAETVTITNMLTKWRESHDYTRDRFGFLMEALRACDLGNLAESFEEDRRRMEQSKKVAPSAKTEEYPGYAKEKDRVTRNIDREILLKVSQQVDFRELCRVIDIPTADVIEIENHYPRNERRVFQVLDSWKRRGEGGNRSISELLPVLAHLGCKPALIDEIMRKDAADDKEEVNPMKQLPAEYTTITFPSLTDEPQDDPCYPDLEVNSMVEVNPSDKTLFGVIRWIGVPVGSKSNKPVAGIELESSIDYGATDGTFNKLRYFQCEPNKAIFVYLCKCRPNSRVPSQEQTFNLTKCETSQDFGGFASPLVEGFIDPPARLRPEFVGMQKGIQGDQNSCYLDSTLFSMFAYNNGVFDPLLRRTQGQGDLQEYEKVQKTLRESIVNPLRKNGFVRADRILQLREHLDQLGTTKGLMSEEKDPEEFLHTLLSEVFKSRPLLKIRHGANEEVDESNIHHIFLEKDESLTLPTVEQLLLQSFQEHDLKLVEAPSCLIVQMPRFGKDYKMYNRILPSLQLDVTNIIEEYPRQCTVCGNLAVFECSECKSEEALEDDTIPIKNFCEDCFNMMHVGTRREHHKPTLLTVPDHFLKEFISKTMRKGFPEEEVDVHRQRLLTPKLMDLFAVICIRTSRYVAFVKAGREKDSEWVFFDSMADRQGDQQGYYIPQITHLKDFRKRVDVDHIKARIEAKQLTEIMKRLLGDAYICMYSDSEQCRQTYV